MGERGYASVLALALLFGGVLLMGLATDVARLVATWREASYLAHTAAETGAGWVQAEPLYSGSLVVDPPAAEAAALAVASGDGHRVRVSATVEEVCVSVGMSVQPGLTRLVNGAVHLVDVTACASPRQG